MAATLWLQKPKIFTTGSLLKMHFMAWEGQGVPMGGGSGSLNRPEMIRMVQWVARTT